MNEPLRMIRVIEGRRYSTEAATLLAADDDWHGSDYSKSGFMTYLYRTPNGAFFTATVTVRSRERDKLMPLDEAAARSAFERLPLHQVPWEAAFPGAVVVDA